MAPLVFGLAFGTGFGAWRTTDVAPQSSRVTIWVLMMVIALAAYFAGRKRRAVTATATAVSIAAATAQAAAVGNTVNVFVAPADLAVATARVDATRDFADRPGAVRVPAHMGAELTPLEQHVGLVDDVDPSELLTMYDRGELDEAE